MCFFPLIGHFLMNLTFRGLRSLAILSVFNILATTLICSLCRFYGMYADAGFFFIFDIDLDIIGKAESLVGSEGTRVNQVQSATTVYKC